MTLKQKTLKGLFWAGLSQGGKQTSQVLITAVLARMLSPGDFGLVGMAGVFTGFAAVFAELGVSTALIQKQDIDERHLSTAFWLNMSAGAVLTIVFILLAPLIAYFFKSPELKGIVTVMSLNFLFSSLNIVQQAVLQKEMDFKSLTIRDLAAAVISGAVGIFFAWRGYGAWSLVYQLLTFTLVNSAFLWGLSPWRPKLLFSREALREMFRFGSHMTGFQLVNYCARNVDQLLIGRFLGAQALGYYSIAYKIMLYPVQNVSAVINKVMFPAFSRIQADQKKISTAYMKMVKTIGLVTFPLMGIIFCLAPEIVVLFLGGKWLPSVSLIRVICFAGMAQSVGGPIIGTIRLSQGKTDIHLKIGVLNGVLAAAFIIIALPWGILGVAISYTIFSILWALYTHLVTLPLINAQISDYLRAVLIPAQIGLLMIISLCAIKSICSLFFGLNPALLLAVSLPLYFFSLLVFKQVLIKSRKLSINL